MTNYKELLSKEEIAKYKAQGYSEEDIQNAVNEIVSENPSITQKQKTDKVKESNKSHSFFPGINDENLIRWQLELDSILERIEHMLRGDRPKTENGSIIWRTPDKEEEKIFNEFGVAEIMRVLCNYVNRNTILSNYREEVINAKMLDLGNELADLIFLKYEDMGLNTLSKRKLYPIIVREMVDVVHSSYLRALHGGERESLREARTVNQTDQGGGGININTGGQRSERGLLNPMRYVGGKYK